MAVTPVNITGATTIVGFSVTPPFVTTDEYTFSFPYLDEADFEIKVNSETILDAADFEFASTYLINLTTAGVNKLNALYGSATSVPMTIRRRTQITSRLVDFQDAAILTEADLDLSANQLFYLLQEGYDSAELGSAQFNPIDGSIALGGARMSGIGAPISEGDVPSLGTVLDNVVTPDYTEGATYRSGRLVFYQGDLYRANTNIASANAVFQAGEWDLIFTDEQITQITTNQTNIATNTASIATNAGNISTNTTDIATNAGNISTNTTDIATNAANITSNDTDIATNAANIATNTANIATNTANITSNDTDIAANAANLATHEGLSSGVHGVTGSVVGTTDAQDLSNKAIIDPTRTDVKKDTRANLDTYATTATDGQLVFATDEEKFYGVKGNALVGIGGGLGSPQTISIVAADDLQSVADFSGKNTDIEADLPSPTAIGAAPSLSTTASELLTGADKVIKYTAGATSQFDYFGHNHSIPQGWAGRTLAVEFTYRTASGYTDGDMSVEFLSFNGSTYSYLANKIHLLDAKESADGNGTTARFLVNVPSDCQDLKVAFQNLSATSGITFFVDKISVDIDDFNYKNVSDSNSVSLVGTDGRAITSDSESIYWSGSGVGWTSGSNGSNYTNGNFYTIQKKDSILSISGNIAFTASVNNYIGMYLNGSFYRIVSAFNSTTRKKFDFTSEKGEFQIGDKISFGSINAGFTSSTSSTLNYLNIIETSDSKHVVVDSGDAETEFYRTNADTSNFWDATGSTNDFDISLIPLTDSKLIEWNDTTETRLVAKQDVIVNVRIHGVPNNGSYIYIFDSDNSKIAFDREFNQAYLQTISAEVKISRGDYIYFAQNSAASRTGGISITARKATLGEYHLVPVTDQENVFSARIGNNGTATITSESSSFIESVSRTAAGRVAVTFKSGIFTVTPSVVAIPDGPTGNKFAAINNVSSAGFTVDIDADNATGTDHDFHVVVQKQGADYTEPKAFIGNVAPIQTAYLKDVQDSTSAGGGTFTSGAWRTRPLNTVSGDSQIVSLSSNQFTLSPGKYEIEAILPANRVDRHLGRLRDITNSATIVTSHVAMAEPAENVTNTVTLMTTLDISSSTTYEVQHACQTTRATDGFGRAHDNFVPGSEDNVYAQVKITKIK